jgi:hypothetical protein
MIHRKNTEHIISINSNLKTIIRNLSNSKTKNKLKRQRKWFNQLKLSRLRNWRYWRNLKLLFHAADTNQLNQSFMYSTIFLNRSRHKKTTTFARLKPIQHSIRWKCIHWVLYRTIRSSLIELVAAVDSDVKDYHCQRKANKRLRKPLFNVRKYLLTIFQDLINSHQVENANSLFVWGIKYSSP